MKNLHGFELLRQQDIPELKTQAKLYRHKQTGAELLSLTNDDENKVFGITFRTPPSDATGVAHIMEHSVLCGSRKFPVKDPFVQMVKGSLNTFLNALTFADKTCYPVASTNLQDFYNLIDVYLDAVFHPLLTPQKLQQEGWRYDLESAEAPLAFKGIVFNEMKGSYSSPDRLLGEYSQQLLFPGHTYGVDSGGDPAHIPDLTWAQFKKFHEDYYHPSNARIFFYGDDDPETRLRLVQGYLKDFRRKKVASAIPLHERREQVQRFVRKYDAGEETGEAKAMVTVNWLLEEMKDPVTTLELSVLTHILLGTPASPLHKVLIDSGLGEDVTGAGLGTELRQMYFSVGLKGVAGDNVEKIEPFILQALQELAEQGLDPNAIEASLNTVEFRLRENNTGSYPRGLVLMFSALSTWLHEGDPFEAIAYEKTLATLKERAAHTPRYFEEMIKQQLLSNQHRVTVTLAPDPNYAKEQEAAEQQRLAAARAKMSAAKLQEVIANTQALQQWQETPDPPAALATLPMLKRSDLERNNKQIPLAVAEPRGTPILYHDLFTNGIVYLEVGFNLHVLPQELLPYLPLFSRALLEMGTTQETFVQLLQRIGRKTGGIYPSTLVSRMQHDESTAAWLILRGKAMLPQAPELLAILRDILLTARFDDQERFRQMVLDEKASREAALVPRGHGFVSTRLRSRFDEAGWMGEQMGGVSYLFFVRELVEKVNSDWPAVVAALEKIRALLVNRSNMFCNVTLEAAGYTQFQPQLNDFLETVPNAQVNFSAWQPAFANTFEGLTIPAQVNYVGKGANIYKLGYKFHGSALVISNFLHTTWLWERVRMQGGAYGGFCSFDRRSGVFNFLSYRDPNLLKTIENYDAAARYLREVELSEDELTKNIIGVIGDLDSYQLPDAKGYTSMVRHLVGDDEAERQRMREEVLGTTAADFRAFADVLEQVNQHGLVVVMGPAHNIEAVNAERKNWLQVTKVM
ncbi:insulinase family protein [candidate division KSB1 bacterium]|nr:insulinase family protein [candidate division KSB1 bacterium]